MAEEFQNAKNIIDTLTAAIQSADPSIIREHLKNVCVELNNYIMRLNNFYNQMQSDSMGIINQYEDFDADKTTVEYALFKKLSYQESEIEELLKEGYILMDLLRTFFTGETITYTIGLPYRGVLYEKQMTIEELFQYTHAEYGTKSKINNLFKLRMTNKKGLREALQEDSHTIVSKMDDASTVWSSIWHYIKSDSANNKNKNLGNAYEVYRVIVGTRGTNEIPPPGPTIDEIESVFDKVRSNTASSMKGGDFMTEQIKYFSSAPSLVTTSLIRSTLTDLLNIFTSYLSTMDSQIFKKAIADLYLKNIDKNEITDAIEIDGLQAATKYLDTVIQGLQLKHT